MTTTSLQACSSQLAALTIEKLQVDRSLEALTIEKQQVDRSLEALTIEKLQVDRSLEALTIEKQQVDRSLEALTIEKLQVDRSLEALTIEKLQVDRSLEALTIEKQQVDRSLEALTIEKQQTEKNLEEVFTELTRTEDALQGESRAKDSLAEQLAQAETSLIQLNARLAAETEAREGVEAELREQTAELNLRLEELEHELDLTRESLESENTAKRELEATLLDERVSKDQIANQVLSLRGELEALQNTFSISEIALTSTRSQLASTESLLQQVESARSAAEIDGERMVRELAQVHEKLVSTELLFEKRVDQLKEDIARTQNEMNHLQAALNRSQLQCSTLETQLTEEQLQARDALAARDLKVANLEEARARVQAHADTIAFQLDEADVLREHHESQIRALDQKLQFSTEDRCKLENQLATRTGDRDERVHERDEALSRLGELEARFNALVNAIIIIIIIIVL